jgi:predicted small secreted protein
MRILFLLLAAAFLSACATQPNVGVGGQGGGRASEGGVRVGVPF